MIETGLAMGFRKDKQEALERKKRLQRNRDVLVECGLPTEIYDDHRNWLYFLDHATLWAPKRPHWFCLAKLTRQQLQLLCDFLQAECGGMAYDPHVLQVLQGELGIPQRHYQPRED